jgi:SAM-dependent methyltransferase
MRYVGGPNAYRPIVEAVRAEISRSLPTEQVNAGANYMFGALYLLLERLSESEPRFQMECARERGWVDELFAETPTPYKTLLQYYATRILARMHFGSVPIIGPSLDIGCGDGLTGKFTFTRQIDIGGDISSKDLEQAERVGVYRKLKVINLESIPYPDGHFQTVFCINALYHADDKVKALGELLRVTGGTLYFNDITPAFAAGRPMIAMLERAGFTKGAVEFHSSILRPQVDIEPLLRGRNVERRPMMSAELMAIIYAFYDLEVVFQIDGDAISEERKTRTLAVLRKVVAPLLAQDAELAATSAGYWSYCVSK